MITLNHDQKSNQNRNRNRAKYSLLVAMMILVAVLGQRSLSTNSNLIQAETKAPQSAGSWTLTAISIDNTGGNDWVSTESSYDWCTGSGTKGDPYLIENVTVTPGVGMPFRIRNSREIYFKIQNCSSASTSSVAGYGGITIENSEFGELIGNNFSEGDGTGIVFVDCDNMTVQDNLLSGNGFHGILLSGNPESCDENTFIGNIFINNSILAIYLNYNNSLNIITENFIDGLGSQYDGIAFTNFGDYNTVT
ncbi:MAG: right-handed parallel beta-helix repeat-containing protein, partial [Promethearchaeota archaeon]